MSSIDDLRHRHYFLGEAHEHNERKTWIVIGITSVMMVTEIVGGIWFGSVALIADGLHMSTHTGALLIAALAYTYSRRYAHDQRFAFGTGKLGDLAAFASAIVLAMVALLIAYESVERFFNPVQIAFDEAIPIAFLGLIVNLVSAFLLRDDHHHHGHGHGHDHDDHDHDHDHDHHHDHDHDHHGHDDHGHDRHAAYRRDNNLRAAFLHVAADVVVSVLVIIGLFAARALGWLWLDPMVGLLGATVVAIWSWSLIRSAGAVLLDMSPDPTLPQKIADRLEQNGDRIFDLHLWRIGPGHVAGIVSLASSQPQVPSVYRRRLADLRSLSHVTIEVELWQGATLSAEQQAGVAVGIEPVAGRDRMSVGALNNVEPAERRHQHE
jgi:cation diffusion facilitator family transporter